ncbi:30S ribosomal protein S4, chloroplastic [Glycine soja]
MSRYRGPRFKKIRRLGSLPGLTSKRPTVKSELRNQSHSSKKSQYHIRLEEKQKLHFHYGLIERKLLKYVRIVGKAKGSIGQVLLQLLEMRLDNILFWLGMAATIPQARQLVNHKHVLVNGHIVDIPSYRCKPQDIIIAKDEQKSKTLIQNYLDSAPTYYWTEGSILVTGMSQVYLKLNEYHQQHLLVSEKLWQWCRSGKLPWLSLLFLL